MDKDDTAQRKKRKNYQKKLNDLHIYKYNILFFNSNYNQTDTLTFI